MFDVARANYVGVFGTEEIEADPSNGDGTFFHNSQIGVRQITDGASSTMIVGERSSRTGFSTWTGVVGGAEEAMARVVGATDHPPNDDHAHVDDFSSDHAHGAHFVFGDISVRIVTNDVDLDVYRALATRKAEDGELIGDFFVK